MVKYTFNYERHETENSGFNRTGLKTHNRSEHEIVEVRLIPTLTIRE